MIFLDDENTTRNYTNINIYNNNNDRQQLLFITMALLLETTLGDLVIDLDLEGSPELCKNVLKLAKARYYTQNLIYNIQANRFCQFGCPFGDGSGGACMMGLLSSHGDSTSVLQSQQRFLKSDMGRCLSEEECRSKGVVVATEMNGIPNTIGSQLLITIADGNDKALDGYTPSGIGGSQNNNTTVDSKGRPLFRSLGTVSEDTNNILDQLAATYCDPDGRPYADIRIIRALVIDDPFDDPPGLSKLMEQRGIVFENKSDENDDVTSSPNPECPPEEKVAIRISADQLDAGEEEDFEKLKQKEEELLKRQDKSRAVVLEMLGDLPSADIKAPENVLFVCKLNPVTEDEDLELIFSRFDENVKVEIIRDPETGSSLQYAFVEFSQKPQAVEAYFKMNNALVDDRRIKVDFSQSVAKVWNKYTQRERNPSGGGGGGGGNNNKFSNAGMPRNPMARNNNYDKQQHNRGGRDYEPRRQHNSNNNNNNNKNSHGGSGSYNRRSRHDGGDSRPGRPISDNNNINNNRSFPEEELDQFGRRKKRNIEEGNSNNNDSKGRPSRGGQGREDDRYHRRRSRSRDRDTHRRDDGDDSRRRDRHHYHGNMHRRHERPHERNLGDHDDENEDRRRGNSDGDMQHHGQRRRDRHYNHERKYEEQGEMTQDRKRRESRDNKRGERSPSPSRRRQRSPRSSGRSDDDEEGDNGRNRGHGRDEHRRHTGEKKKSRHHGRHRDNSAAEEDDDSADSRRHRRTSSNSKEEDASKERHHRRSRHHHHRSKESSTRKHSRRRRYDSDNDGSDNSQNEGRRRKQKKDGDDDENRDGSRSRHHRHHNRDDESRDRHSERKKSKRRHRGDEERRNERKRRRRRSRSHSRSRS